MKRLISSLLAVLIVWNCCTVTASASHEIMPMASTTIVLYAASMTAGAKSGQLYINYNITAKRSASAVGASSIEIYKSDGTLLKTISGSTSNGLVSSGIKKMGTYCFDDAVSGQYYYAVVTLLATIGSDSDSETVTTATVKAP